MNGGGNGEGAEFGGMGGGGVRELESEWTFGDLKRDDEIG